MAGLRTHGLWPAGAALAAALFAGPAAAAAQSAMASVTIEVRDQTGAVLPDVLVTMTNQGNGIPRRETSSQQGTVVFARVGTGLYTLVATRDGFKTEVVRDIWVQPAIQGRIVLALTPGALTEQIIVTADPTTVRIGNSAVGAVFEPQELLGLPAEEREALHFAVQAPGMAPPAPGSRLSTQGNTGVNSSGAREASNNFLLDGVDNNDLFLNRLVINPSLDAIQEFALLQNTYDAEYGRSNGAQVSIVLKSGTRDLHGSAYEFFRHSAMDARNAFLPEDEDKPLLQRHQFGGTIGGPVKRLPSFYFVNVEAIDGRESETRLAHVPTALERAGDFSQSAVTIRDPFTGQPFAGNIIPGPRISAAGQRAANLYPTPNRGNAQANFVSSPAAERNAVQFTVKTDHHLWNSSPLTVRYSFSRDQRDLPFPVRSRNLPGFGVSVLDRGHNLAVGFTSTIRRRALNEVRFGLNGLRRENLPQSAGTNGFAALGINGPSLGDADQGFPTLVLPGFETLGDDPNLPVVRSTRTLHMSDALSFDIGRHQLKAGGEFRTYRSNGFNHLFARGQATFQGVFTGSPVGDLLMGFPTITLLGVNDNPQALRTWSLNGFLQDDWRLTRRLTMNAGVRYEYNASPYDADDRMKILDLESFQLLPVGVDGVPRSGLQGDINNVAPRIGASWDITGRGTVLLRGGYGVFYDSGTLIENSALYFNPPFFSLQLFFPGAQPLPLEAPFPIGRGITPRPAVNTLDPDFRTGYSQEATIGLERVFGKVTTAVRYVTSYGDGLVRKRNINQPPPGPGSIDSRRPIPGFGDILLIESKSSSDYHALQVSAVRRPGRGVSLRAAYTLSKSMDDTSAFLATDGDDNTPQNSRDLAAEWGPSDYDVRHRLVLTGAYEVPSDFRWRWLRLWQVSGVFTAQSGRPFTPRVSFDNSNTGNVGGGTLAYDRPNVVNGPLPTDAQFVTYQGRTLVIAPRYTFGNAGRDSLTGPNFATLDAMVARRITLTRGRTLQLRVEIFNALNRRNYQLPDTFVDRVTFGQSLATYPPRQMQIAARFAF
jgi:Carboxypeptidase regulatory-like domain